VTRIVGKLFRISPAEVRFARRGFAPCPLPRQQRLERVGEEFLGGYHAAIDTRNPGELARRLECVDPAFRGFAYEGAAMAWALLDHLFPWTRGRFRRLLSGPGAAHAYMVHVGAGWALARLPWVRRNVERACRDMDPLLRWLVVDGYGFHEGYFHWPRTVSRHLVPAGLHGYARRAFDQGLGRVLWFVGGADVERIPALIAAFPGDRHSDLWAGLGLASAYAGGITEGEMRRLWAAAGVNQAAFAQGVAFAAKARQRAGNPAPHTELACQVVWQLDANEAAEVTDRALESLEFQAADTIYELWRRRVQQEFATKKLRRAVEEVKHENG
jgi:enediyne biosynthesis protein E3